MKFTSSEIAAIVNGKLYGEPTLIVEDVITDSRHFINNDSSVFFAIQGKNHDGHQFIKSLYDKGLRIFVVGKLPENQDDYNNSAFILTRDTIYALQLLAAFVRKKFSSPVIGITGSAGKTIVKEWIADVLGISVPVIRSPKSYNSQIGVPLSVMKLDEKYKLGIFEAGISYPGEMEKLQKIIDPDIGVITNIGDAHNENFSDLRIKALEKLRLFKNSSMIVYCSDQNIVDELILSDKTLSSKELISWSSEDKKAVVFVRKEKLAEGRTCINLSFKSREEEFIIPFTDRASVENAITVAVVCIALNTDTEIIRQGLESLVSVAMRMEMKTGINNCQLIEDYYNSDPGSLGMAIDYLKSQKSRKPVLILSDFVQSGRNEKDLYGEVAALLEKTGIDKFIGIGPALSGNSSLFSQNSQFFFSTEDFIRHFNPSDFGNQIILLKGARKFEFEKIGILLELKVHQTVMEVNLDAISHNLNVFRRLLNPGTRIMAMVKAFAYGAGPAEIAGLLEYHRVSYLGVANADEGVELRNAGVTMHILVMNPDPAAFELMIRHELEPEIYSFSSLAKFTELAARHGQIHYPVHIKIDTGMHRLGFMPADIDNLSAKLGSASSVKVISVFSHFSASDDPDYDQFTHRQADIFLEAVEKIREGTGYNFLRHICNSAGIVRFPQYQFEMVRPGIGIYGIGSFEGTHLIPAGRFITRISQIKIIPAGDPVGYGCADISGNERSVAILPVGYADGLSRKLGNRNGTLFIKNTRVPLIGNICMDMCMADVTGLDAREGDEAEIFGSNISIDELAQKCGTIPYEILTSIPGRVKRIFYRE